jgi:hypothetical protein
LEFITVKGDVTIVHSPLSRVTDTGTGVLASQLDRQRYRSAQFEIRQASSMQLLFERQN